MEVSNETSDDEGLTAAYVDTEIKRNLKECAAVSLSCFSAQSYYYLSKPSEKCYLIDFEFD